MAEDGMERAEVVAFLVANENVTLAEANDFMDVVSAAEMEEEGSSKDMMGLVRNRMREVRMLTLIRQVATIDPGKVSLKQVHAIQRVCAVATKDT